MLFADLALARRVELTDALGIAGYALTRAQLQPESGAAVEPIGSGYAVFTGADWPINRAVGLGLNGPVTEADLDQVEAFFRSRRMPVGVDLCPLADDTLVELLGRRGYRPVHFHNMHVRALVPGETFPALPPGMAVKLADTPAEGEIWAATVSRGFSGREEAPTDDISVTMFRRPGVRCYVGYSEGEPGAGAGLWIHGGVAALSATSTRPTFRRRGLQGALIKARLRVALEAGCDLATVMTAPGNDSQRNVERAGFRVAYTKVTMIRDQ